MQFWDLTDIFGIQVGTVKTTKLGRYSDTIIIKNPIKWPINKKSTVKSYPKELDSWHGL